MMRKGKSGCDGKNKEKSYESVMTHMPNAKVNLQGRLLMIHCHDVKKKYCVQYVCNKYYLKTVLPLANSSGVVIVLSIASVTIHLSTICISESSLN